MVKSVLTFQDPKSFQNTVMVACRHCNLSCLHLNGQEQLSVGQFLSRVIISPQVGQSVLSLTKSVIRIFRLLSHVGTSQEKYFEFSQRFGILFNYISMCAAYHRSTTSNSVSLLKKKSIQIRGKGHSSTSSGKSNGTKK